MPMRLEGSCQCGSVVFSLDSNTPYPFQLCYCSICRKTAGSGGFGINIMGITSTLTIQDDSTIGVFHAVTGTGTDGKVTTGYLERKFCLKCGTPLWAWDKNDPGLIYPFVTAIDTELPVPPERIHLMLGSKASWVVPHIKDGDQVYQDYPQSTIETMEEWHRKRNLWIE